MSSVRISSVLNLFAILLFCGFVVATAAAVYALRTLRVGGPISQQQTDSQILLADILPPPLYVVEALLTADTVEKVGFQIGVVLTAFRL